MDILRSKCQDLCYIQNNVRRELNRAGEIPKDEEFGWFCYVCDIRGVVSEIEALLEAENTKCFSNKVNWVVSIRELKYLVNEINWVVSVPELNHLVNEVDNCVDSSVPQFLKHHVIRLSKKVDVLIGTSPFADEKFVVPNNFVPNVRDRSQLLETIWGSMMDPKVRINGIYGYGGVGKTTAMRNIRDELAASNIFEKIFWVTLSKDLSLHKLQSDIALQMNLDLPMHADVQFQAAQILQRLMKMKKFLIIFDNMCQPISLKEVGIPWPKRENGCKIVLITRFFSICNYMESDIIVEFQPLSEVEAWDLFVNKAGSVVNIPEIQPFAKQVVKYCRGLPIGIVSVGHAMREELSVEVWRKTCEHLHKREVYAEEDYVFKLLRFSYKRLNNDKLKNCFLYCAFFPSDYLFKPDELIRYWMAEKFINEAGDIVAEIDEGFKILKQLQDANMLQMFAEGGEVYFKMHALLRDFAIRIMKPELCIKAGLGLMELPFTREWAYTTKMSLMRNSIQWLYVSPICPQLSSLLLHDNPISDIISPFFRQMCSLKFLDLSYSLITELPSSLSELSQLRVLFLHYCTSLKNIPSLLKLKKLRSLSLCGTAITELPDGIEGLVRLRSLDLSETKKLESIRVGLLSSLSRLEELRLQGSGLCKMNSPIVANYLLEMKSLKSLAILTLSVVGYGDHLDTIMFLRGQNLKIFSVNMYGSIDDYIEEVEIT